ncbi:MAG TPA: tRNA (adenosine(37)-N6)-threonylcarbamoyltransferase complex transferase subunit TsaD [bacterium]
MLCLGIETSCDETAVAVLRGRQVLAEEVASQVAEHATFGGVVPELASRRHLEGLDGLVTAALGSAGVGLVDLDLIAVTRGPGLLVALLVGMQYAKGLAAGLGVPLIGVNHVTAHLEAVHLDAPVAYPYLGLVVSGGHTHLFRVAGSNALTLIGHTVDDAAGEAYDKVGKMIGLPYPSGAVLDGLAQEGDPAAIALPRPMLDRDNLLFSFSGLKTAVRTYLSRAGQLPESGGSAPTGAALRDLAASFQAAVVETIVTKTVRAARREGLERLVVGGGVACNAGLRAAFAAGDGPAVHFLPPRYCTDNGVMVAALGMAQYAAGVRHDLDLAPVPNLAALLEQESATAAVS